MSPNSFQAPELAEFKSGTAAQVAWAISIRARVVEVVVSWLDEHLSKLSASLYGLSGIETGAAADLLDSLAVIDSASWWINHRHHSVERLIAEMRHRIGVASSVRPPNLECLAEATLRPEGSTTDVIAEIRALPTRVEMKSERLSEAATKVLKDLGMRWDSASMLWYKAINRRSGTSIDRAAEIGNAMLLAGVPIRVFDESIRAAAVSASFAPEQVRWILLAPETKDHDQRLVLKWARREDLYQKVKHLSRVRWDREKQVAWLPLSAIDQVDDLVEHLGFSVDVDALHALEAQRLVIEKAILVHPSRQVIKRLADQETAIHPDLLDQP